MIRKIKFLPFTFIVLFSSLAFAAQSPVRMLDKAANKVITELKVRQATVKKDPATVYSIINRVLIPHVDVPGMSRSVIGRKHWKTATVAQRKRFGKQFTQLLVHTYAGALAQYTKEEVKFYPVRGGYVGKRRIKVDSEVKRPGAPNIPMSYRLILRKGSWKIYDMSVEGVSLLHSFRSQFRAELQKGSIEGLISRLKKHNARF